MKVINFNSSRRGVINLAWFQWCCQLKALSLWGVIYGYINAHFDKPLLSTLDFIYSWYHVTTFVVWKLYIPAKFEHLMKRRTWCSQNILYAPTDLCEKWDITHIISSISRVGNTLELEWTWQEKVKAQGNGR